MQRLFSMFPRGTPGIALLLLRAAVLASMWTRNPQLPGQPHEAASLLLWLAWISLSLLIGVGLLTPFVAVLCLLLNVDELAINNLSAILSALSLALLGPGGHSVDAWLFGRRVVVVTDASETKKITPTEKE